MASRPRREVKPSAASGGAASAIEQLKKLRESGAKSRLATMELEEEKAIYDVVDEDEYARIVAKRRAEAGNFLVGGDDDEYLDLGEDILGKYRADEGDEDQSPEKGAKGKKRKESGTDGGRSKKKLAAAPDPNGRARMQKMMMLAQARAASSKKDESSDALLESILDGLGGDAVPIPVITPKPTAGSRPLGSMLTPAPGSTYRPASLPSGRMPTSFVAPTPSSFRTPAPRIPSHTLGSSSFITPVAQSMPSGDIDQADAGMDDSPADDWDEPQPMDAADEMHPSSDGTNGYTTPAPKKVGERGQRDSDKGSEETPVDQSPAASEQAEQHTPVTAGIPPPKTVETPVTPEEEVHAGAQGWRDILEQAEDGDFSPNTPCQPEALTASELESVADLEVDENGQLPMFFMDVYEQPDLPDRLYMFGKVPEKGGRMVTACAVVQGLHRSIFFIPAPYVFADADGTIAELEARASEDPSQKGKLVIHLQERAAALKAEVKDVLHRHGIKKYGLVPVKRNYAFDGCPNVTHGPQWVLKVRYSADQPQLPSGLTGKTFRSVFGAGGSLAEAIMLKRKIMGPSWILLSNCVRRTAERQVSWCKVELELKGPKQIITSIPASLSSRAPPPITVASVSLQTCINPNNNQQQIVSASVLYLQSVSTEVPMTKEQWSNPKALRNFTLICKAESSQPWPFGFEQEVQNINSSHRSKMQGGNIVMLCHNERALLVALLGRLQNVDPDVLVGHNITGWDLPLLLQRMNAIKVPHWSRVGRLRRNSFPDKLAGSANGGNSGASPAVLTCTAGRLLCDTHSSARELVREVDYSLGALTRTLLGQSRMELTAADVPSKFSSIQGLKDLMMHAESDAWLTLGIMFHLSVLPLTRQLAALSGFSWGRTLLGNRAQRIEMLLLHEFHARKFLLPNRLTSQDKAQRRAGGADVMDDGMDDDGEDKAGKGKKANSKGPQYLGGLVLEPKKGLYDKIIILLDFNSLYPSIIQEYNICFTTVQRPKDGSIPVLPETSKDSAPLPTIIRGLVQKRRAVKHQMKATKDTVLHQQLNIRQQAIKLTANSMYGCLGFTASRFYAKPLAELITSQGRQILGSTVEAVQSTLNAEVVYGDTDSIMVHSGTDNPQEAMVLGQNIQRMVNKKYKLLEIELEALMCPMLLLKKKKYAAIKMEPKPDGTFTKVMEQKGLDIVRRDWSLLSKECGQKVLNEILSGKPIDDVVTAVHDILGQVRRDVEGGHLPLGKFVITKQLTKRPQDYPDSRNQPHVQVALRRKKDGKKDGIMPGETVPYIICRERAPEEVKLEDEVKQLGSDDKPTPAAPSLSSRPLAERAFHPEEVRNNKNLVPDVEYYLTQQVHPVVSRLCAPIDGTDPALLAHCLGLDTSRYAAAAAAENREEEALQAAGSIFDNEARYKSCQPLELTSSSGDIWQMKGVLAALERPDNQPMNPLTKPDTEPMSSSSTLSAAQLSNQVLLQARRAVSQFYDGWLHNEDDFTGTKTRSLSMRQQQEQKPAVAPRQLYNQLCYYHRLLDVDSAVTAASNQSEEVATRVRQRAAELDPEVAKSLSSAAGVVNALRESNGFHWVSLNRLFGQVSK